MIIVAGFKSLFDGHQDLYSESIRIHSLHVIGENDEVINHGENIFMHVLI